MRSVQRPSLEPFARRWLILAVLSAGISLPAAADMPPDAVNAVLGDASWQVHRPGVPPSAGGEVERIRLHLAHVEALLRAADSAHLDPAQRTRRRAALDLLAAYREAGVFPRRTDDAHRGRRPRFIDDRGVHCAVGHLLAATGSPALAAAIRDDYEYAYVPEIAMSELLAWADSHGFSVDELAMIQPAYGPPPSPHRIETRVRAAKDALTLVCGRDHEVPSRIRLVATVNRAGRSSLRAQGRDPFALCFAENARANIGSGGAYMGSPATGTVRIDLEITSPQAMLEGRLAAFRAGDRCTPRPGPIPERASLRASVGAEGLDVRVETTPRNAAVADCLETILLQNLRDFAEGPWQLEAQAEIPVDRRVTSAAVRWTLETSGPHFATECHGHGAPSRVEITVRARVDDAAFQVAVQGGEEAFRACVTEHLLGRLNQQFTTNRQVAADRWEPFFRIDGDVLETHAFAVESPASRDARLQKDRERDELMRSGWDI